MADDGFVPSLTDAQRTQLTRLDIVHVLNEANVEELLKSCFVRVLLEIETGNEDYRIFTVKGVGRGATYRGFSSDQSAATDLYIDLNLPNDLRGINGIAFQLNSISNSRITESEYSAWRQSPGPQPYETRQAYVERLQRLQQHPVLANRRQGGGNPQAALDHLNQHRNALSRVRTGSDVESSSCATPAQQAGSMQTITAAQFAAAQAAQLAPSSTLAFPSATAATVRRDQSMAHAQASPKFPAPEIPTHEAALRAVMEELREKNAIFANPDFEGHKTSLLRTAERDLADYLDNLREAINMLRQVCVVCMDRPPTVITLPCKHKVLCRLCASQVASCPCCRETAVEVFEPIEP